ncbi:hypothetical protein Dimus_033770, partial [Dionaea muscipula]
PAAQRTSSEAAWPACTLQATASRDNRGQQGRVRPGGAAAKGLARPAYLLRPRASHSQLLFKQLKLRPAAQNAGEPPDGLAVSDLQDAGTSPLHEHHMAAATSHLCRQQ